MEETNFIISLTTLPNRIKHLKRVIDSLCNQKYDNYEVHLNVPTETQFDGTYDADLEHLKNDKLKIFFVEDVGAVTKLYYTLLRTNNAEQRIITVDDDLIYDEYMLDEYNYQITKNSNDVIGFTGIYPVERSYKANGTLDFVGPVSEPMEVGILEGYKSVCYMRKHFTADFFKNGYKLHYNDDLAVFSWLGMNGIKKVCIPYRFELDFNTRMLSFPLKEEITYPKSGINHQRDAEGGSAVSYKKFYNSTNGIGLHK
jgi:glycosyltransferase involved in cell wall biosynthesis